MIGDSSPRWGLTEGSVAIVIVYILALFALGVLTARRRAATRDYFLASRGARWPTIGLSLFAANISSIALVGLTGSAYASGVSVFDYEWTAAVILVFFCLYFLPSIIKSGVYTMPEYLERRYDRRARLLFALLTLFLNVTVDAAGVLYSGSLVCQLIFPGWSAIAIVAVLAGVAGIYTIVGGLRSVMYTEVVQSLVLFVSATVIALTAFQYAGGWRHLVRAVPPEALSLIRPASDASVPWPGLLLGIPIMGFYYWCTNQNIVQSMLAARNIEHARWGALFAGLLKLSVLPLVVLPGICALLLFPHLPRADLVYPALILHLLPNGLIGLTVAAFVAATIVGTASLLNSSSTLITMDVVRHYRPDLGDRSSVWIGRVSTACLMLFAVLWAPQVNRFPSLWQYLQGVLAYAVAPVVVVFLGGKFWRGANAGGALATLLLGSVFGFAFFLVNGVWHFTHLHFLYAAPILTALDTVTFVVASKRQPRVFANPPEAVGSTGDAGRIGGSVWADYRLHAALLMILTGIVVVAFR